MKSKRKTTRRRSAPVTELRSPIESLATNIARTESLIRSQVTTNVRIQTNLNKGLQQEQSLRTVLSGLHREMDKHTASTRLR